jgi:hypothetical protein
MDVSAKGKKKLKFYQRLFSYLAFQRGLLSRFAGSRSSGECFTSQKLRRTACGFGLLTYSVGRKRIETTFNEISNFIPRTIHAVIEYRFILKVVFFIIGYAILKTVL